MTSGEAQEHLEAVSRGLENAAGRLVETPSRVQEFNGELEELARLLESVYESRSCFRPNGSLAAALRNIQTRVGRVQVLLERAVTFYCGAISGAAVQSGAYTAHGEMRRAPNRGYLKVEG